MQDDLEHTAPLMTEQIECPLDQAFFVISWSARARTVRTGQSL
jgi:hypothetical protein